MYLSLASKIPRNKMEQFSFQILDYILKKIGKEGSLIIPVFDESSVKRNFLTEKIVWDRLEYLEIIFLKKKFKNRTFHPLSSFDFWKRKKKGLKS